MTPRLICSGGWYHRRNWSSRPARGGTRKFVQRFFFQPPDSWASEKSNLYNQRTPSLASHGRHRGRIERLSCWMATPAGDQPRHWPTRLGMHVRRSTFLFIMPCQLYPCTELSPVPPPWCCFCGGHRPACEQEWDTASGLTAPSWRCAHCPLSKSVILKLAVWRHVCSRRLLWCLNISCLS